MRISDWSSDVCSSDLQGLFGRDGFDAIVYSRRIEFDLGAVGPSVAGPTRPDQLVGLEDVSASFARQFPEPAATVRPPVLSRSEEHTSELQSLMRISYSVFCLNKKNNKQPHITIQQQRS